jgi:hypothetical protein
MSEKKIMEHFKECTPAINNTCASLSISQSKLKRNVILLRQVKSLKKRKLSLRKAVRDLRLQAKLEAKYKDEINNLTRVAEA